ncbi:MAG: nickel ABC transporter permease [Oscillospiraceae bacterium]
MNFGDKIVFYVLLLVISALGLGLLIKPELMWKIDHFATVKNGGPTDFYLNFSRIAGVITLVVCGFVFFTSLGA